MTEILIGVIMVLLGIMLISPESLGGQEAVRIVIIVLGIMLIVNGIRYMIKK